MHNLQGIIKHGLLPSSPPDYIWPEYDEYPDEEYPDEAYENRIFVTPHFNMAKQYADNYPDPIILRIPMDGHDWKYGETDDGYYYSTDIITPNNIEAFSNGHWLPIYELTDQ